MVEDAIAATWNDLTLNNIQSIFRNRLIRSAWVSENRAKCILGHIRISFLNSRECGSRTAAVSHSYHSGSTEHNNLMGGTGELELTRPTRACRRESA
jgi:hypothetical protein